MDTMDIFEKVLKAAVETLFINEWRTADFSLIMHVRDKDITSSYCCFERGLLEFYIKLNEYSRGRAAQKYF